AEDKKFYEDYKKKFEGYVSGHKRNGEFETLFSHSRQVTDFFIKFCESRGIEYIFDNFFRNFENIEYSEIKKDLLRIIFLHDIGKLNPLAQEYYMGKRVKGEGNTTHNNFSVILILIEFWDEISPLTDIDSKDDITEKSKYSLLLLCLIYAAKLHHGNLSKIHNFRSIEEDIKKILKKDKEDFLDLFEQLEIKFNLKNIEEIIINSSFFDEKFRRDIFFCVKLFYSCLVMSDYYATYCYRFEREDIEINQINKDLIKKFESNFYAIDFNSKFKNQDFLQFKDPEEYNELNELRDNLLIQSSNTLNKEFGENRKIFMLNVPTGGGKTNISLKLSLDILNKDKSINRINWVFPFVNLIDQNYNVIKNSYLGDKGERGILSKISYKSINLDPHEFIDYEKNFKQLMEQNLNLSYLNNPINIISNVNFFNSFFKAKKQNRYKIANFVNSIVVLDEIQSIDAKYLHIFYRVLDTISKRYNIYFLIMSATLPNINEYNKENIATELVGNYKEYFNHPIFKRNKFIFEEKVFDEETFKGYLEKRILKDHKDKNKFLVVLNTINSSVNMFRNLIEDKSFEEYSILLLNSYVNDLDRKRIVEFVKKSKEKLILISTQSIEAGIDLDFDIGFRDNSILDSIEQVAGRVNRECKKDNSLVYIFNLLDNAKNIYGGDKRFKIDLDINKKTRILNEKDFSSYYNLYFNEIKSDIIKANDYNYFEDISSLGYRKINELNLIENKPSLTLTPNKISQEIVGKDLWKFLEKENIKTTKKIIEFISEKKGFEYKPLIDLLNKIISMNSINVQFFDNERKNKFVEFLRNKEFLKIDKEKGSDFLILDDIFFKEYFIKYFVKNQKFSYFDISKLKGDIKSSENESFFI
ncbi:MAG: CRISPR-associated helicase Cas3', partial [archaeon]